jgi:hypothetical protein
MEPRKKRRTKRVENKTLHSDTNINCKQISVCVSQKTKSVSIETQHV